MMTGIRSKLWTGIGVAVCHSSPSESHGLAGAFWGAMNWDHIRLATKIRNDAPRQNAAIEEKSFKVCRSLAYVKTRRGWPNSPMTNIGKNVRLKKTNIVQKCHSPSFLFIVRPVIFGSQKYRPAKNAKMRPPMIV